MPRPCGLQILRSLFATDPERFAKLSLRFEDLLLDYSKHLVDAETMRLLLDLAHAADVENWRAMMFEGRRSIIPSIAPS